MHVQRTFPALLRRVADSSPLAAAAAQVIRTERLPHLQLSLSDEKLGTTLADLLSAMMQTETVHQVHVPDDVLNGPQMLGPMGAPDGYGAKQIATMLQRRRVLAERLPTLLFVTLGRFHNSLVKHSGRVEFPASLSLAAATRFAEGHQHLDWTIQADASDAAAAYELRGVVVHSGTLSAGHYWTLTRQANDMTW